MEAQNNLDARLAAELARPFLLPGQTGQPLSFRALPDGGMVVIAVDGRKLWFTCREVNVERQKIRVPAVKPTTANDGLNDPDYSRPTKYTPHARIREGTSDYLSLPPDLKYLEKECRDKHHLPGRPRSSTSK